MKPIANIVSAYIVGNGAVVCKFQINTVPNMGNDVLVHFNMVAVPKLDSVSRIEFFFITNYFIVENPSMARFFQINAKKRASPTLNF